MAAVKKCITKEDLVKAVLAFNLTMNAILLAVHHRRDEMLQFFQ